VERILIVTFCEIEKTGGTNLNFTTSAESYSCVTAGLLPGIVTRLRVSARQRISSTIMLIEIPKTGIQLPSR